MPAAAVDLIVFAIQAGVKLLQTGRKVYVEATIGGDVEVPLPPVFAGQSSPVTQAVLGLWRVCSQQRAGPI